MSGEKLKDPPSESSSSSDEDAVANSSSSEEEETGSESEAETAASPVVKPPADSKEVETSSKPETKKRSHETDEGEVKRVKRVSGEDKKKSGPGVEETKKNYFQRVWTEEDEITLLQGFIDYRNETGSNPHEDKNAVYDLVKKSVSFDVSKTQFMEKVRALKKKFENNLGRSKKGKDPYFSKAHDRKAFDLAKLVWCDNGIMAIESSSKKVEPAVKKQEEPAVKEQEEPAVKKQEFPSFLESLARFGVDDLAAKRGWSRFSVEDKEMFEEEWKVIEVNEFKLYSQKSGCIHKMITKMAEDSERNH